MKAVITGATGAIGMALLELLEKNKIETLVLCRKESSRAERIMESKYIKKANCSLDELNSFKADGEYDVFFHFAWDGTFGETRDDLYLQADNVKYTLDAVNLAKRLGCKTFIGAGSQAEYGKCEGIISPETPTFPEMGYGIAKLSAGLLSREEAHKIGVRHIWVRIFSIYGPYDTDRTMVMSTVRKLLSGETPAFTPAEQMWDYLYSKDAARAFLCLAEKGRDGAVYCLGSGSARPLKDYITEIRDEIDKDAALDIGAIPYNPKQTMFLQADISKLIEDTGFSPEYSFKDGIRETVAFAKDFSSKERRN